MCKMGRMTMIPDAIKVNMLFFFLPFCKFVMQLKPFFVCVLYIYLSKYSASFVVLQMMPC